ncbi:hypothetical protein [Epibacterium sp. Ofav1-8]|uniref:hypothetical protein n=1 Tax=Epibacterium sp. Ofav1-8 TaxID=2917735 RepID=UPI001EF5BC90|nr:hypothetical protein [Epibacterium sp. Ofav1-8]MCG7622295.1 hypothetical protein [Epibacterium sp. Ofav1-8]
MVSVIKDNMQRIFSDVISADCWFSSVEGEESRYRVFADISFSQACLSGQSEAPIYFDLSVKSASVRLFLHDREGFFVPKMSVREDDHLVEITSENKILSSKEVEASLNVSLLPKRGGSELPLNAGMNFQGSEVLTGDSVLATKTNRTIQTRSLVQPNGQYQWLLKPLVVNELLGRAWSRSSSLADFIAVNAESLDNNPVRVTVTCKNEDLNISNIRAKCGADEWLKIFKSSPKRAAAAHYIRRKLLEGGLEFRDVEDPYCEVTLADVMLSEAQL